MYLFRAKTTTEALRLKILFKLISTNIRNANFLIDSKGIHLRTTEIDENSKRITASVNRIIARIFINLDLDAENFNCYEFNSPEPLYVGLNMGTLFTLVKSAKKNHVIEMYIEEKNPLDFCIHTVNMNNISKMKIQYLQVTDVDIEDNHTQSFTVNSSNFQNNLKELVNLRSNISIRTFGKTLQLYCNKGELMTKEVYFGESEPADKCDFDRTFAMEQLNCISKICGLSSEMKIFVGTPVMFQSQVGNLGVIQIYVKSKEEREEQSRLSY